MRYVAFTIVFFTMVSAASAEWQVQPVAYSGGDPAIAVDSEGRPRISYNVAGELRYAAWNGASWNVETVSSMDSGAWEYNTSLALDNQDCPHIAHCTSPPPGRVITRHPGYRRIQFPAEAT